MNNNFNEYDDYEGPYSDEMSDGHHPDDGEDHGDDDLDDVDGVDGMGRQPRSKRRSKNDNVGRTFVCGCGKSYLGYPALYTHIK